MSQTQNAKSLYTKGASAMRGSERRGAAFRAYLDRDVIIKRALGCAIFVLVGAAVSLLFGM